MPRVRSFPSGENFSAFRRLLGRNPNHVPFFPFGLFSDSLLGNGPAPAPSDSEAASPSALNLIEALSALGKGSEPAPAPSQPLLIELQGDRYVRLNSGPMSESSHDSSEPIRVIASAAPASARSTAKSDTHPVTDLPPVSLIFRDGHTEQVRDYSIIGGVMYARGDYYTDGYWNKQITLASIDVPATFKANNDRSVKFVLPSSPNEVITRP